MNILKEILEILYDCLTESRQKLGTFLHNKICLEINEIVNDVNESYTPHPMF